MVGEEPATTDKAKHGKEWHVVMLDKMAPIEQNKTWSLVDLPTGQRAIGLKWVFKLKHDEHRMSPSTKPGSSQRGTCSTKGLTTRRCSCRSSGWSPCACSWRW